MCNIDKQLKIASSEKQISEFLFDVLHLDKDFHNQFINFLANKNRSPIDDFYQKPFAHLLYKFLIGNNNVLSKSNFIEVINTLQSLKTSNKTINDVFRNMGNNSRFIDCDFLKCNISVTEPLIVYLLETIFKDNEKWIEYYIYELDYGVKYPDLRCYCNDSENNQIEIDLSSSANLYDFLIYNLYKSTNQNVAT